MPDSLAMQWVVESQEWRVHIGTSYETLDRSWQIRADGKTLITTYDVELARHIVELHNQCLIA